MRSWARRSRCDCGSAKSSASNWRLSPSVLRWFLISWMKLPANSANSAYCSLHTAVPKDKGQRTKDKGQNHFVLCPLSFVLLLSFRPAHRRGRRGGGGTPRLGPGPPPAPAARAVVAAVAPAARAAAVVAVAAARRRLTWRLGRQTLLLAQQRLA